MVIRRIGRFTICLLQALYPGLFPVVLAFTFSIPNLNAAEKGFVVNMMRLKKTPVAKFESKFERIYFQFNGDSYTGIKPPKILFHWLSNADTRMMPYLVDESGKIKLPPISQRSNFIESLSRAERNGKKGLFAWSNPVTGMAGGRLGDLPEEQEIYGRMGSQGEPPRLLGLKIDPKAKVKVVRTFTGQAEFSHNLAKAPKTKRSSKPGVVLPPDVDLAFHVVYWLPEEGTPKELYKEWIILNPRAIKGFSADPAVFRDEVARQAERLKKGGYPAFLPGEQHYMDGKNSSEMIQSLDSYLASTNEGIPKPFLENQGFESPKRKLLLKNRPPQNCWVEFQALAR